VRLRRTTFGPSDVVGGASLVWPVHGGLPVTFVSPIVRSAHPGRSSGPATRTMWHWPPPWCAVQALQSTCVREHAWLPVGGIVATGLQGARVEPTRSGGDHLLVHDVAADSVARFARGGLRCRVRCTRAPPVGALGARLAAVATRVRRAGRCGRSATGGLDRRGGSRLRCPLPAGKLAAMIASNSTCRSPASAQMRSANASEVPLVVASRCPRAARSGVGWSVMAAVLPVVPGRDGVRR
jgi:hypothetical protein